MLKGIVARIKKHINPVEFYRSQGMSIGQGCELYPKASFGSEPYLITLGNNVRVNNGVHFITHDGGVWVLRNLRLKCNSQSIDLFGQIAVGDNVHIGTNAIILPGVSIGNNCVIGVGAVVTHDIPDNSIAVGVPARVIETVYEYAEKHINDFDYTKHMNQFEKKAYLKNKYHI